MLAGLNRCCSTTPSVTPAASAASTSACGRSTVISSGLFQKHVLAGRDGAPGQLEMRVGRRQHHDRVDSAVREDRLDIPDDRQTPTLGKGGAVRFGRAIAGRDLDAVLSSIRLWACGGTAMPRP